MGDVMGWSVVAIAVLMVSTWLLSVIVKNASIVESESSL